MTKEIKEVSAGIKALAAAIKLNINEKGQVVAEQSDIYASMLPSGLIEHNAFEGLRKHLPSIVSSEAPNEEKVEKIIDAVANHGTDIIRAKNAFDGDFVSAYALSFAKTAQEHIKANPDVNRVVGKIQEVGRNVFAGCYDHTYTKRIPGKDGSVTEVEAQGRMNISFDVVSTRRTAASLVAVRELIAQNATKGLAD